MIYQTFDVENYKGISNAEIDLRNNRILCLVGLNESGKTTIMEALKVFHNLVRGGELTSQELKEYRPKGVDFSGTIKIEARLGTEPADVEAIEQYWHGKLLKEESDTIEIPDTFKYSIELEYKLHQHIKTRYHCDFPLALHDPGEGEQIVREYDEQKAFDQVRNFVRKEIVPEIVFYDDFIFEIPEKIIFGIKAKADDREDHDLNDKNNRSWSLVVNDILKSVSPALDFQEHVVDSLESDKDAALNRLARMEAALNEKITNRWAKLFSKEKVNFKEIELERDVTEDKFSISFKIKTEQNQIFPVKERSKGFKWFFSFLLFTEFRKMRTENILFLLDEPASNLHSTAQAKILDALEELSRESLVIYSTHSHHMINPAWLAGAYVCINEAISSDVLAGNLNVGAGASIKSVKYFKYVGEGGGSDKVSYFQPILDRLDYCPSSIEPVPEIVILEGKNDWYTLKYLGEVVSSKGKGLFFYPGGGADKLHDIVALYLAWGKNFIVMLDGDSGGEAAKKRYLKAFGPVIEDKIFTIKDILSMGEAIEKVFSDTDREELLKAAFGEEGASMKKIPKQAQKDRLNLAIRQLTSERKAVKITAATMGKFDGMFKFFNEKLADLSTDNT